LSDFFRIFENSHPDECALIVDGKLWSYQQLSDLYSKTLEFLNKNQISGKTVNLNSKFSAEGITALLALWSLNCVVSLSTLENEKIDSEINLVLPGSIQLIFYKSDIKILHDFQIMTREHEFIEQLKKNNSPGLVIYTSGTMNKPKAVLHDVTKLSKRYTQQNRKFVTLLTMDFDRIGGLDLVFRTLMGNGTVIVPKNRRPGTILDALNRYHVQVLPGTATLFRSILLSGKDFDCEFDDLKYIVYGAEFMPQYLLNLLKIKFPKAEIMQTYGSTELGTLRTVRHGDDCQWLKLSSEGTEFRVNEGMLEIKSKESMVGYLNAESPFTKDGWYKTGDLVERIGQRFRIIGRRDDLINVGGNKVSPLEVEEVIQRIDGVYDATVYGVPNSILGQIVGAKIETYSLGKISPEDIRKFCAERLPRHAIPMKIKISLPEKVENKMKKTRLNGGLI